MFSSADPERGRAAKMMFQNLLNTAMRQRFFWKAFQLATTGGFKSYLDYEALLSGATFAQSSTISLLTVLANTTKR
jgi:hypothetical protein